MSKDFELNAKAREDQGKGASRRLRRLAGEIPAIVYGAGKKPKPISLSHKELSKAIENEAFFAHIITLHIDGKKEQVVIKDLQRHPAKPFLLHADFLRVRAKEAIQVNVPIHFLNEDNCKGVKQGHGSIIKNLTELEVSCLPKDLPEYVEVDLVDLDVGETLHISDIPLPEGVSSVALSHGEESDHSLVTVVPPRVETEDEDEEAADSAAEESEEKSGDTDSEDESKDDGKEDDKD